MQIMAGNFKQNMPDNDKALMKGTLVKNIL